MDTWDPICHDPLGECSHTEEAMTNKPNPEPPAASPDTRTIQEVLRLHITSSESMRQTFKNIGDKHGEALQEGITAGLERAIEIADNMAALAHSPEGQDDPTPKLREMALDVIRRGRTDEPHDTWQDWQNAIVNGMLSAFNMGVDSAAAATIRAKELLDRLELHAMTTPKPNPEPPAASRPSECINGCHYKPGSEFCYYGNCTDGSRCALEAEREQRLAVMLYRSLEHLSLAIEGCAAIGFQESSPTTNAEHTSRWNYLNDAQKDAKLKLKHYAKAALANAAEKPLLHESSPLPDGCYCKPGQCMAPVVMGRRMQCRDPQKASAVKPEGKKP